MIKSEIIKFYNDPLYQELKAYYSKNTIFNILKIERNENRHSAFLAWLLDENGSHGLGEEPLRKWLRFLYVKNNNCNNGYDGCFLIGNYLIENLEVGTEKDAEFGKEHGRIDVYLAFDYRYDASDKNTKRLCVILENKMFTKEHGKQTALYRDWALKEFDKKDIVGVFMAPNRVEKCSGDMEDFKFLKTDYQDLLDYVLEPLLLADMSQETRSVIQDYVINLEQPLKYELHKNDNSANNSNADTILAVSKIKHDQFLRLYSSFSFLLDSALIAKALSQKKDEKIKIVYGKDRVNMEEGLKTLMIGFWDSNESLLRMIMNAALRRDDSKEYNAAVNDLLGIKESNRDNTRYLVYNNGGQLMNEIDKYGNGKPVPKSLASFYIFKAWLDMNTNASIDIIRAAFPVESILQYEKYPYQYLFYWCDDIDKARKQGPADNATYYKSSIDEKTDGKKYLQWDFYGCDTPYYLKINKEGSNKKEKVLSMKMWLKDEFDLLVKYAKSRYGILVKEQ